MARLLRKKTRTGGGTGQAGKADKVQELMAVGARMQRGGRFKDAAAAYGHVLTINPSHAQALTGLGIALRAQGLFEAAVGCYRRSLHLAPAVAHTHSCLGNALKDLDRVDEAQQAFERHMEIQKLQKNTGSVAVHP